MREIQAMADDDKTTPPDEWLKITDAERPAPRRHFSDAESSAPSSLSVVCDEAVGATKLTQEQCEVQPDQSLGSKMDDVFRQAASLAPLDQLKLIARLWTTLPALHRGTLIRFQLNDIQYPPAATFSEVPGEPAGQTLQRFLFDRANTSELYSAPRRFDLATIFVVTAAFSLLLGGLTALDFGPPTKVVAVGLISLVAVGQALLHDQANPRGVSVVIGAAAYTLFSWILWLSYPRVFPNSFLFVTVINGLLFGAVLGYIAGVLVGGMFLVADVLRRKFLAVQAETDDDAGSTHDESSGSQQSTPPD